MIAIILQGVKLDLKDNTTVETYYFNSATKDEIKNDYVQRFTLPSSDHNQKTFKFATFIETRNRVKLFENSQLIVDGDLRMNGTIALHRATAEGMDISISANGFVVASLGTSLKDITWPSDVSLGANTAAIISHANGKVALDYPNANYVFPQVKNEDFYANSNPDFEGIINAWDQSGQTFQENTASETPDSDNKYNLVPYLFVHFVIEQIVATYGYSVEGEFMEHAELMQLLLHNNFALDAKEHHSYYARAGQAAEYSVSGSSQIIALSDDSTPPFEDTQNVLDTTAMSYAVSVFGTYRVNLKIDLYHSDNTQPYHRAIIYLIYNIVSFQSQVINLQSQTWETFDLVFELLRTSGDVPDGFNLAIAFESSSDGISWGSPDAGKYRNVDARFINLNLDNLNSYATNLSYKNHVPDITIGEFFNGIKDVFNLNYSFDHVNKTLSIDFANNIPGRKALDLTGKELVSFELFFDDVHGSAFEFSFSGDGLLEDNLVDLSDYNYIGAVDTVDDLPLTANVADLASVRNNNRLYAAELNSSDSLTWTLLSDNYYPYEIGDDVQVHIPLFSPLFMQTTQLAAGNVSPEISEKGSSPAFSVGINEPARRLVFWRGLQPGSSDDYPLASATVYDYEGNVIGALSLIWDEATYGLYVNFWEEWMNFWLVHEKVTLNLDLTNPDLKAINVNTPIYVRGHRYIIDELAVNDRMDGKRQAEAKLLKDNR